MATVDGGHWIGFAEGGLGVACQPDTLLAELSRNWPRTGKLPHGVGVGAVTVPAVDALDSLMGRAAQLARSLPNQVVRELT